MRTAGAGEDVLAVVYLSCLRLHHNIKSLEAICRILRLRMNKRNYDEMDVTRLDQKPGFPFLGGFVTHPMI